MTYPDPVAARQEWRYTVHRHLLRLGRQFLTSAGPAADEGRMTDVPGIGARLVDAGRAHNWFIHRLNRVLGPAGERLPTGGPTPP